jgi:hypothetical protein
MKCAASTTTAPASIHAAGSGQIVHATTMSTSTTAATAGA